MRLFRVAVAAVLVMGASCASEPDTVVGKPPPKEEVQVRQRVDRIAMPTEEKKTQGGTEPEPMLAISGWPFQDATTSFRLHWQGGQNASVIYAEPSLNATKIGEVFWNQNEEVITRGTIVAIFQPSVYRAKEATRIEGFVYDSNSFRTGQAAVSYDIAPGETVEVYHYRSEGICYMGVRGRVIEGNCPTETYWNGNFKGNIPAEQLGPVSRIWWVEIVSQQASGWIQVDDRFSVDIESI